MIRKGASFSPGDRVGSAKSGLFCRVKLLDGSECVVETDKKVLGQTVFDHVLRKLGILERDYFGLQFEDEQKTWQWLDLLKPVKKQLKKFPCQLHFRVRYYSTVPMRLRDNSRNQFFLQLKQDITKGRLFCPPNNLPSVISYLLQADMGDFESEEKDAEYMAENRLLPEQPPEMESEVVRFHQFHRGMNALEAVNKFLKKARDLDFYGIQLFNVRYEDQGSYQLGLTPFGVGIHRGTRKISFYSWSRILQVTYKSKKFTLRVRGHGANEGEVNPMNFDLESAKACKDLWKSTVDHVSFYSEAQGKKTERKISSPSSPSTPESPPSSPARTNDLPPGRPRGATTGQLVGIPGSTDPAQSESGQSDSSHSQDLKWKDKHSKAYKARSLPKRLPSNDPILVALRKFKEPGDESSGPSTPTSPEDLTSPSQSEETASPIQVEFRSPFSGEKERVVGVVHGGEEGEVEGGRGYPYLRDGRVPESGQEMVEKADPNSRDVDLPAPSSSTTLTGPEDLSQDDMHGSLFDLADALGGGSEEERDTNTPLAGEGVDTRGLTNGQAHTGQGIKPSGYPSPTIRPSPLPDPDRPPPKPPRIHRSLEQATALPQDKKKQNRKLVRHWVQEHQLRSLQSSSQHSLDNSTDTSSSASPDLRDLRTASSQDRPSPDLRDLRTASSQDRPSPDLRDLRTASSQDRPSPDLRDLRTASSQDRPSPDLRDLRTASSQNRPSPDLRDLRTASSQDRPSPDLRDLRTASSQDRPSPDLRDLRTASSRDRPSPDLRDLRTASSQDRPSPDLRDLRTASSQDRPSPDLRDLRTASSHSPELRTASLHRAGATPSPLAIHRVMASERNRTQIERSIQSAEGSASSQTRAHDTRVAADSGSHDDHVTEEQRLRDQTRQDYPLPLSPPPPPYMSPSPDSEQALVLQQLGQRQQPKQTSLAPKGIDSPDLSSVDEIIMSQTPKEGQEAAKIRPSSARPRLCSPERSQRFYDASLGIVSPELFGMFEAGTDFGADEPLQLVQGGGSQPPRKHSLEEGGRVEASVEARHQRRFMERRLRKTQKKLNQLKDDSRGSPVQPELETGQTSSGDELPPDLPADIDPSAFIREEIQIDPRNLMDVPSPIYDRLEQVTPASSRDGSVEPSYPTTSGGSVPETVVQSPPVFTFSEGGLGGSVPETVVQSPPVFTFSEGGPGGSLPETVVQSPPVYTFSNGGPGDVHRAANMENFLQEMMTTDNLPPPPPHLLALSQELEGHRAVHYMDPKVLPPTTTATITGPPAPTKGFDSKMFLRPLKVERERPSSASSACDTSRYPPEIASFMTRVRNRSTDGSNSPEIRRSTDSSASPDVRHSPDSSAQQPDLLPQESPHIEKRELPDPSSPQVPPTSNHRDFVLRRRPSHEIQPPPLSQSPEKRHTPDLHGSPRSSPRSTPKQGRRGAYVQQPGVDIVESRTLELPPNWDSLTQPQHGQGDRHTHSFSLPLGQGASLSQYGHDGSRESTSSTPHTQSDPVHSPMEHPAAMNPRMWAHPHDYDRDVRRAQSFNVRPFRSPALYPPQTYEDDSIPNSPTFFINNPPNREEHTPSPHTEAMNRSFQEHLESLEGHRKGRKSRVLDWMQKTSVVWKQETNVPLVIDPETHVPMKPYLRPSHLYEDPDVTTGMRLKERRQQERVEQEQERIAQHEMVQPRVQQRERAAERYQQHPPQHERVHQQQHMQHEWFQQPTHHERRVHQHPHHERRVHRHPHHKKVHQHERAPQRMQHEGAAEGLQQHSQPERSSYHAHTYGGRGHRQRQRQEQGFVYPTAKIGKDFYVIDV